MKTQSILALAGFGLLCSCSGSSGFSAQQKPLGSVQQAKKSTDPNATNSESGANNDGNTNSQTNVQTSVQTNDNNPFQRCATDASARAARPIKAKIYQIREQAESLEKDFPGGQYKTSICMTKFDVPVRDFTAGFPDIPGLFEWFALEAKANLVVNNAGTYNFRLLSDDGARLYIDNKIAVDNDGVHKPQDASASLNLSAGEHEFRLQYFQGPRTQIALQLFWTPPGASEQIIPTENFHYVEF